MIDNEVKEKIDEIHSCVNSINQLMAELYLKNVEIRIAYKDSANGGGKDCTPHIELWRATEHIDYLKE